MVEKRISGKLDIPYPFVYFKLLFAEYLIVDYKLLFLYNQITGCG